MKVLLGVTSGIAIYKSCELVRMLVKAGHEVRVIMSPSATQFIQPYLFERLSHNKVYVHMFESNGTYDIEHISLAQWADVAIICPATMATIGKIANGIADNMLVCVFSALPKTIRKIVAPAMNENMWLNPANQKNLEFIAKVLGYEVIEPTCGDLACGITGKGRLAEIEVIFSEIIK